MQTRMGEPAKRTYRRKTILCYCLVAVWAALAGYWIYAYVSGAPGSTTGFAVGLATCACGFLSGVYGLRTVRKAAAENEKSQTP